MIQDGLGLCCHTCGLEPLVGKALGLHCHTCGLEPLVGEALGLHCHTCGLEPLVGKALGLHCHSCGLKPLVGEALGLCCHSCGLEPLVGEMLGLCRHSCGFKPRARGCIFHFLSIGLVSCPTGQFIYIVLSPLTLFSSMGPGFQLLIPLWLHSLGSSCSFFLYEPRLPTSHAALAA